ncbi:MAG: hypothetical protein ACXWLM_04135 [Myxococcales bacterium]
MKIGTLFSVNAVIAGVFGIAFTLAPAQTLAPYGVELPFAGLLVARLFGAALVGFGIISWLLRAADASAQRAAAIALTVADALGFLISLWGVLAGAINALGWSTVAIYGLLAAGFALQLARKPAAALSP